MGHVRYLKQNKRSSQPTLLITYLSTVLLMNACSLSGETEPQLFQSLDADVTGIDFENRLVPDSQFNVYRYRNFYNGGGVAAGDITNNGLPDLYLISNSGDNKLYINRGGLRFEDVTETAGVAGTKPWSTGVSFVDIN
jgi:enediyne biosynthesis protein E4